ncbi:H+/K+-exchanging ATPase [Blastomyces gilchristii SLH14081]|uniref:H+/K+-exchanging ATPase n=1 Tax=Blastomyces gilchristii (strain SLH14081) TaxID=559298 RepID=A0A179UA25_BLAGS|nr:H+/K+-exchanging ATPase [Blastomyces gilchristii SLH14081]OAT04804.1 H+/K+-exchanging ATPase [Blastomyces gilchristii SLH14081]
MAYVFGGFGLLLFIGCILVFIAWKPLGDPPALANLALAIVLAAVFVIQAAFNAWQDWSSSRVMASITTMLPDECMVVRENGQEWTTATELVPGDVVKIKQGNKLPSDLRFIEVSSDAKFDRSILTGKSEPAQRTVDSTDKNYLETRNIGLQGTHCVSGSATGVCVATGDNTVFGRIAQLANKPRHEFTPLQKKILRFVLVIVGIIITVVVLVVVLWQVPLLRRDHTDWINLPLLIVSCVSVGIAFVPEGLPVAVALSLTIGANIMKKNKILCKTLATVETLGSVSVICTDKTGNLTKNEMFVTDCYTGAEEYTEEAARIANHGREETDVSFGSSMNQLRRVGGLRNAAEFDTSTLSYPPDKMKMYGDPTDQAILRFSESLGSVNRLRSDTKKVLSSPSTAGTNP